MEPEFRTEMKSTRCTGEKVYIRKPPSVLFIGTQTKQFVILVTHKRLKMLLSESFVVHVTHHHYYSRGQSTKSRDSCETSS